MSIMTTVTSQFRHTTHATITSRSERCGTFSTAVDKHNNYRSASIIIQRVSKNVTTLIWNICNKLEPISIIFAHSLSRIFATNHNYIFLLN